MNESEILSLLTLQRAVQLFTQSWQLPLGINMSDLYDGAWQQFRHIGKLAMQEAEASVSINCRITERLFTIDVVDDAPSVGTRR